MYTWFDALLVTLLAFVTALGARRGMHGLVWGLSGVAICVLVNALLNVPLLAGFLALLLSAGASLLAVRLIPEPGGQAWRRWAGGLGGLALGGVLLATLTLNFPIEQRRVGQRVQAVYPATTLPAPIYDAVEDSLIKRELTGLWDGSSLLQTLIIPDQLR
ncbi:hypothetical protein SAMN04488058_11822 [Deinococcus reticulitermitis]|uniref:Colicin V production protein n=1 Tax=Deinococcus reticulitermitis TaxID=856736 RepID=A0A1H7BHL6_9DEIO|nr:hypothetical protein [Deinococcus reticulitermitis]SEJ77233.1 hypothetical protein SAMN04488058_11822 [Deinococcus reticulitermitis]